MNFKTTFLLLYLLPLPALAEPVDYDRAYAGCLDAAGGASNATVDACAGEVARDAEAEIAERYDEIHARIRTESPEDAARFEEAQKSWRTYRNLHCKLAGRYVGSPMYAFCPMKLNVRRVKELRAMTGQ